jgi:PAS domain S-box-containing protein
VSATTRAPGRGSFEVRLPPQPASVATARQLVRDLLDERRPDLSESAELLVSEVVTNALLHAGTDISLAATLDEDGVEVQVGDGSLHLPSRRRYGATAGTGRGLKMLESLVDDWGVVRHADGKTVWFRLGSGDRRAGGPVVGSTTRSEESVHLRDKVHVRLDNMPLLLHAAWQEHAEALLREYLLVSLDDVGEESIQMHAEAVDAIALLEEHVPPAGADFTDDVVLEGVVEPLVSADTVDLPVPRESIAHFETLDRAIQAALDLSADGLVLTPPTQPEVEAFRRWLCRQVLSQSAGGAPEPWTVPDDGLSDYVRRRVPPGWDPSSVTGAGRALIASDEGSQILAISPEATALLGYDDPSELLGQRVVAIVPERYRQAHVAGFTMYLLVGRRALIGRPVLVPALRRDGSEIDVEMQVDEHRVGEGRSLVVAELRPVG